MNTPKPGDLVIVYAGQCYGRPHRVLATGALHGRMVTCLHSPSGYLVEVHAADCEAVMAGAVQFESASGARITVANDYPWRDEVLAEYHQGKAGQ